MPEMGKKTEYIFLIINDYVRVINEVLLAGSHTRSLTYCLRLLSWQSQTAVTELNSCDTS